MEKGISVAALYMLISFISYVIVKYQYIKSEQNNRPKISWFYMVVISLMFTYLNWYSTGLSDVYGSDRINYMFEFSGKRSSNSLGLDCIFFITKNIGGNIENVFYVTTFLCVFIILLAYKISIYADYNFFALLLTGEVIINSFTSLKQSYACAFAYMFFVFALEGKSRKRMLLSLCFLVLSCIFHVAGAILIPVYILLLIKKYDVKKLTLCILMIVVLTIYMNPVLVSISDSIVDTFPVLAYKIRLYMVENYSTYEGSSMAFIKYMPIYYITMLGLVRRKRLVNKIENYNKYMLVSVVATSIIMYSSISYWFSRFTGMFYFPIFMFFILMNKESHNAFNKFIHSSIVYGVGMIILIRKIILIFINYGFF